MVSNRVISPDNHAPTTGGLAVAVVDALHDEKSLWVGWNGKVTARNHENDYETSHDGVMSTMTWSLSRDEYDGFYRGFSNEVIWPVFHSRMDRFHFSQQDYDTYLYVNQLFAQHLAECVEPDDIIWVHDYHFMHLASYCRQLGLRNRIGFFLHIPFPCESVFRAIPVHEDIAWALQQYQLLGFQTVADMRAFQHYLDSSRAEGSILGPRGCPRMGAYPIGIDCDWTLSQARRNQLPDSRANHRPASPPCKRLVSVDRLDYTKGLKERLQGYDTFLEQSPAWCGEVVLQQISPLSRVDVLGYQEIRATVEGLVGQINGRWGTPEWIPINYMNRSFDHGTLLGLLRASHVGLVTSLRDGMNLVAKEYVMAQDETDPGVLILSEFAGAAQELAVGALIINPYDTIAIARAISQACDMSRAERQVRHQAMLSMLRKNDLLAWKDRFLRDLRAVLV